MMVLPPSMFERLRTTPLRDLVRGRVSGSLAWRRHIAICGLPEELKGVVLDVTRRTRLWRFEKVEVAQELIAHFYDGLDSGASPGELIERFGDVKTAAKLIKRAKKRNRPWPWHVWRRSVQAVGVLFLAYAGMAVWFLMQTPVVSMDYAAQFNAKVDEVPQEQLAWQGYLDAWTIGNLERISTDCFYITGNDSKGEPTMDALYPQDAAWGKARAVLQKESSLLASLRSAGQKPTLGLRVNSRLGLESWRALPFRLDTQWLGSSQPPDTATLHMSFLSRMRKSATLLANDMLDAADAGAPGRAAEDYKALVGMSLQLHGYDMVTGMVSLSVYSLANENMALVMTRHPGLFSREQLEDLANSTARGRAVCQAVYPLEKMRMMNLLQHIYSDDGGGDGNFTLAGYLWWKNDMGWNSGIGYGKDRLLMTALLPPVVLGQYSRRQAEEYLNAYFNELERRGRQRIWEPDLADYGNGRGESFQAAFARTQGGTAAWRNAWIWRALPMSVVSFPTMQIVGANAEALRVVLALEAYKRDRGRYPILLGELAPGYLTELPVDPSTGKALLLRYEAGMPVVYGRGLDGHDDGGVLEPLPVGRRKASTMPPKYGEEKDWILFPVRMRLERK